MTKALHIAPFLLIRKTGTKEMLGEVYWILDQIRPLRLNYRGTAHLKFSEKTEGEQGCYLKFRSYNMEVRYLPQQV